MLLHAWGKLSSNKDKSTNIRVAALHAATWPVLNLPKEE